MATVKYCYISDEYYNDNPDLIKEIDEKVRHYYKLDETRENAQEEDDTLLNLE